MTMKQKQNDGISLRTVHFWLIVGAIIISALMFVSTYHLSTSFRDLANTSEKQIELRKAARELMDASDYLTESVQRFTVLGDRKFLDDYFREAFESKRREEAVSRMFDGVGNATAFKELESAMDASLELMNREYYAMNLVIRAKGITDYPDVLNQVELSEEDRSLSPDRKMQRAAQMVHDDDYYAQKNRIREDMRDSLNELETMAYDTDASALSSLGREMALVRVVIVLQTIGIIIMVWITSRLGIRPVLNAVDQIKADSPISEAGANEFRYLARAYNKMYEIYKSSLERLNFKASHDELTGAYNRAGYELLLTSVDLNWTYMLLFDIDNFKGINDTYGHETGDKVLIKLVQVLRSGFRSDDYICRIGGDEFIVFMVHSNNLQQRLLARKIEAINKDLADTDDGLPPISVSVGIVHGSEVSDVEELFEKTDAAMYRSKQSGKSTYSFGSKT